MFNFLRSLLSRVFGSRVPPAATDAVAAYGGIYEQHLLYHLFVLIHSAYKVKAAGGTDSFGVKWSPLKPQTIADRFPRPIPGRLRGNLTKEQDKLWRKTFAVLRSALEKRGNPNAEAIAAGYAWKVVKAAGAITRLQLYGSRKVDLLIKSGRLLQSIAPGQLRNGVYRPDSIDQIAEILGPGKIKIGSKVPYFDRQNRLRPIIPADNSPTFTRLLSEASDLAAVSAAKELQRQQ